MIEAENLRKTFGQTECLKGVSFSVSEGSVLGFLGPNGAGKTTTIKILTGLLRPSLGTARLDGFDVQKEFHKIQPLLGYLPEDAPAYPEMRIEDFLRFVAGIKNIPAKEQKRVVEEALDEVEMLGSRKRLISNISKGMRQRVGLAQAILGDPKIVILDEPTVGLDPSQIVQIRNVIKEMAQKRTVLFSTHILPNVSEVCSHVVIISNGTVLANGPLSEIGSGDGSLVLNVSIVLGDQNKEDLSKRCKKTIQEILPDYQESNLRVQQNNEEDKPVLKFELSKISGELELRQELLNRLISEKLEVVEYQLQRPSLEDIFLRAVSQPQSDVAA